MISAVDANSARNRRAWQHLLLVGTPEHDREAIRKYYTLGVDSFLIRGSTRSTTQSAWSRTDSAD